MVLQTRRMLDALLAGGFVLGSDAHHAGEIAGNHATAAAVCALLGVPLGAAANYREDALAAVLPALAAPGA